MKTKLLLTTLFFSIFTQAQAAPILNCRLSEVDAYGGLMPAISLSSQYRDDQMYFKVADIHMSHHGAKINIKSWYSPKSHTYTFYMQTEPNDRSRNFFVRTERLAANFYSYQTFTIEGDDYNLECEQVNPKPANVR